MFSEYCEPEATYLFTQGTVVKSVALIESSVCLFRTAQLSIDKMKSDWNETFRFDEEEELAPSTVETYAPVMSEFILIVSLLSRLGHAKNKNHPKNRRGNFPFPKRSDNNDLPPDQSMSFDFVSLHFRRRFSIVGSAT